MDNENEQKLVKINQDIKQRQITAIKDIIRLTFERMAVLEKERGSLQEQIKILKLDLIDLKEGRLDRIHERQCMSEACKDISAIQIAKEESSQKESNPWYINYEVTFNIDGNVSSVKINNSVTKMHAAGSYKLKDGSIKYL